VFNIVIERIAITDASRASLAAVGINSVKAASVDPKRRVIRSARKDPKASAASSGTVITVSPT
jgi:hypothetical protein